MERRGEALAVLGDANAVIGSKQRLEFFTHVSRTGASQTVPGGWCAALLLPFCSVFPASIGSTPARQPGEAEPRRAALLKGERKIIVRSGCIGSRPSGRLLPDLARPLGVPVTGRFGLMWF
ncbi:hypothetical protein O3P69_008827 [Scylla paramamosain]|uniref:Uncharacterized protein n=1 Tax=Scylla paramamosain TaxID=85552 RepID=A0AAW0TQ98_SCYPA